MDSSARTTIDLAIAPEAALHAIERVITEQKHTLTGSLPGEGILQFSTKKTLFTWELQVIARISANTVGSRVDLEIDTDPRRPKALLDAKKNEKAAQKLVDQIRSAA